MEMKVRLVNNSQLAGPAGPPYICKDTSLFIIFPILQRAELREGERERSERAPLSVCSSDVYISHGSGVLSFPHRLPACVICSDSGSAPASRPPHPSSSVTDFSYVTHRCAAGCWWTWNKNKRQWRAVVHRTMICVRTVCSLQRFIIKKSII